MAITTATLDDIIDHLQQCKFRDLCDTYFAEPFHWVIKGTSDLSGSYHDKEAFFTDVIGRLNSLLLSGWKMHILGVYNTQDTLIVEMRGEVMAKTGKPYNNEYCWIFHFDSEGKVKKLTAYYDSLLVNNTLHRK